MRFEKFEEVMRDAQIDSLYTGTTLPLEEYEFWLDPNGADDERTRWMASQVGLPTGDADGPTDDTDPWRPEEAFDFREHIHEALLATAYGVYWFEMELDLVDNRHTLVGLFPRAPVTVTHVEQEAKSGALLWIRQQMTARRAPFLLPPPIPANRLVPYVWRPDAERRWEGRAMLRPVYRNWLCKDFLLRCDLDNHDKAGGIPVVRTDHTYAGGDLSKLGQMASELHMDPEAGAAMPPGAWIELLSAGAGDRIASVRYHDEQMAATWHEMVRKLGTTQTGSRALGESLGDLEALARRSMAAWACRTFTRSLIYRLWAWNFGETDFAPVLRAKPPAIEGSDDPVEEEAERDLTAIAARTGGPKPTRREIRAAADAKRVERLGGEWRGCAG